MGTSGITSVDHAAWLDKHDAAFLSGHGAMLHAFGNDVHFPGSERDDLVPELKRHGALENDEDFIRVRVRMPDKLALELDELELVVIHFGNDPGRPRFREPGELVAQVDRTVCH
jgi:hypothetical protein